MLYDIFMGSLSLLLLIWFDTIDEQPADLSVCQMVYSQHSTLLHAHFERNEWFLYPTMWQLYLPQTSNPGIVS